METYFFSPMDIFDYFKNGKLKEKFQSSAAMGISSVGDILHLTEDWKKGNLAIGTSEISEKFQSILSEESLYIADLDRDRLSATLFEKNENNVVTGFCEHAAQKTISPKRSLRLLSLKVSDESIWWSERVQEEMINYHVETD